MEKRPFIICILSFAMSLYVFSYALAEPESALRLKKMYNIQDNEISGFLEKNKISNPKSYEYFMGLKKDNPELYFSSIIMAVAASRLPDIQKKTATLGSNFEDYKRLLNIPDEEIEKFLIKLSKENPKVYTELVALKSRDVKAYNNALLGALTQERLKSLKSASVDIFSEISNIGFQIEDERKAYFNAKSKNEKELIINKLRRLLVKQQDLYAENAEMQLKRIKLQLEAAEKAKNEAIAKKEKIVEDEINRLIKSGS
ncbi:MAG: hypothetical protein PHO70_06235 [Candidatus Omnitrophica bacterium]|nr:hypothetical protein [Candidatus Omnitrophota bacterium]